MNTDPTDKSTPTEELRTAAAKVRETASAATGGITLVHPGLAEPLARWLELCAAGCEVEAADLPGTVYALTVARAINGTAK